MKLSLLLYALALKLRWSVRRDAAFRRELLDVNRSIVIRTRDGKWARSFIFTAGQVATHSGVDPDATVELVWSDVPAAVAAMLSANKLDLFSAIGRGDLVIAGNLQDALWFSTIAG